MEKIISHQSIYAYMEQDRENGGDLHIFLRYQGKKYKWRGFKKNTDRIPNRKGIEERPEIANRKERSGDWESDLVVSSRKGRGAVATFAERKCMLFRAVRVTEPTADEMVRATRTALDGIPAELRLTMTHDNDKEISKREQITEELGIPVYCARPYRSCDRGLNEFMNRELRRFFPKGTDFSKVTQRAAERLPAFVGPAGAHDRMPFQVFRVSVLGPNPHQPPGRSVGTHQALCHSCVPRHS